MNELNKAITVSIFIVFCKIDLFYFLTLKQLNVFIFVNSFIVQLMG